MIVLNDSILLRIMRDACSCQIPCPLEKEFHSHEQYFPPSIWCELYWFSTSIGFPCMVCKCKKTLKTPTLLLRKYKIVNLWSPQWIWWCNKYLCWMAFTVNHTCDVNLLHLYSQQDLIEIGLPCHVKRVHAILLRYIIFHLRNRGPWQDQLVQCITITMQASKKIFF